MTFYLSNEELDKKISRIKRDITLSMNGIVADQMRNCGIQYKKNMGVAIPRLKEIAQSYEADADLAQRLWVIGMRETMILSTLLQPIEKFDQETAISRIRDLQNPDIVEQICMNLLSKTSFATSLVDYCLQSTSEWELMTGFLLSVRIYQTLGEGTIQTLILKGQELSDTENFSLCHCIALSMGRLCRLSPEIAGQIKKMAESLSASKNKHQQYIAQEIKQELFFLNES